VADLKSPTNLGFAFNRRRIQFAFLADFPAAWTGVSTCSSLWPSLSD
jgi:hypothetical protein